LLLVRSTKVGYTIKSFAKCYVTLEYGIGYLDVSNSDRACRTGMNALVRSTGCRKNVVIGGIHATRQQSSTGHFYSVYGCLQL
jgi:hypothetical protein